MKIAIVCDDFLPDSHKVAAKMLYDLAQGFISQGHDVTVISPSTKIDSAYTLSDLNGVNSLRFKSPPVKIDNKIKRAINETLLPFKAWRAARKWFQANPHDLIVYWSPSIFLGLLINKLKKIWGAKSYLILRDFFPDWAIDMGLIKSGSLIEKYFRFFEKRNYDAANIIGIQSPKNLELFLTNNPTRHNTEVLYNWINPETITAKIDVRQELSLTDEVLFIYGGNMGAAQDMMNLVRLAASFKDRDDVHFLFIGSGSEVPNIEDYINTHALTNVTCLPAVDQDTFENYLAAADIGLFSLARNHQTHNFPGKILGYLRYAKPVLGSVNIGNDILPIINDSKAGFITINGDDQAFYQNALALIEDKNLRQSQTRQTQELLLRLFVVDSAVTQILAAYEKN